MRVVFCRPSGEQAQEDGFDVEARALEELGVEPVWIEMEAVVDDRLDAALDGVPQGAGATLLRSWMLTEEEYERLYEALSERGYHLVNDPTAYAAAHYLPNYLEAIEDHTAPTRWIDGTDLDEAWAAARELGDPPFILKDHVKSAKEDWSVSMIPAGAGRPEFDRICRSFISHRGDRFERGLVFRKLLPLAPLPGGTADQPLFDEYRLFFFDGELVAASPYYDAEGTRTDFAEFSWIGDAIDSRFFTADLARLVDDSWVVLEVGDGGVSTMPALMDPREVYDAIVGRADDE